MKRTAKAHWKGDLKSGKGKISTDSGVLDDAQYSFGTRFESGKGTNPEELIGAAHAGCFAMALSMILGQSDLEADSIKATADVSLEKVGEGFEITKIHLTVKAKIPDASDDAFQEAARKAKENCPVSKVLNADITMDASLED